VGPIFGKLVIFTGKEAIVNACCLLSLEIVSRSPVCLVIHRNESTVYGVSGHLAENGCEKTQRLLPLYTLSCNLSAYVCGSGPKINRNQTKNSNSSGATLNMFLGRIMANLVDRAYLEEKANAPPNWHAAAESHM